jgi:predicted MFS family arabinose efflux permease
MIRSLVAALLGMYYESQQARSAAQPTTASGAFPVRSRWGIFWAFCLLAMATQVVLVTYVPVTLEASRQFGVSPATVGWLAQVFPLAYVIFGIPAGLFLDRYFRSALALGAFLTGCGALLRLVADDFLWAMIGQSVAALGQPLVLNAITGLAVRYMAERHQAKAIAGGAAAIFTGLFLGYFLGAMMPGNVHNLVVVSAVLAADGAALTLYLLRVPPPVTHGGPAMGGLRALSLAGRDQYLRRLCAVVFLPFGTFLALSTFAEPLLAPAGVGSSTAGFMLATMVAAGVVGVGILPGWAHRNSRQIAAFRGAGLVAAGACLHLALMPGSVMGFYALSLAGFVLLPAMPIALALSERRAVEFAGTAAALVWTIGTLGGVVVATATGLMLNTPSAAFLMLAVVTLAALPAVALFNRVQGAAPLKIPSKWSRPESVGFKPSRATP